MRNILSKLTYAIRIIEYEFEKRISEKFLFELAIINLNIK